MKNNIYPLIALFLLFSGIAGAQSIIRGPYLQLSTPSSITIRWRTDTPTSSKVWYGASPANLAFTQTMNGSFTDHEVKISGLSASSTFYYSVGNTAGQLTTPGSEYYFKTSPTPGSSEPVSIWVLGDAGKDNDNQRSVRDAFYDYNGGHHADVILALGDNAYTDGTDDEYQYAWFENMFESTLINSVVWPCPGNHDILSANSLTESGPYYDIFTLPRNGEAGGAPSGTEAYYSFNYGNIHFISLNAEDISHSSNSPMLAWLEQDLAANTQPWVVAFLHRPIYHNSAISDFRHNFLPVLEAGGVDLILGGHQHSYRRSYLINGHYGDGTGSFDPNTMALDTGNGRLNGDGAYQKPSGAAPNAGTIYMVTGSAGTVSTLPSSIYFMPYEAGEPEGLGSVHIAVSGGQMDVKFINYQMQILDYFTISKQVVVASPPTVSVTAPANGTNYPAPQAVAITADAFDSDGSVTQVEFFVNNSSIGVDYQAPYSVNFTPPAEGTYHIVASATDNDANVTQSSSVLFTVGMVTTCVRVDNGDDDGEERPTGSVSLTSSDLELVVDGSQGSQVVGMRFNGLNIPQGAQIANAYIQFTADENTNENPCNLTVYGIASDHAAPFSGQNNSISGLAKTNSLVNWAPSDWLAVGDAGFAQQTPNIASIIQEIVNRPNYSANSSIAIVIEGEGRRTAESFEGGADRAPELCVEFSTAPIDFDCPNIPANFGSPCDDGDNTTLNDRIDANCNCVGTPTACTGIGDMDGDGVCADVDCDDTDPNITHQPGDACDDGNLATINDVYDANCNCVGTLNDCPGIGDNDGDGICADVDCDDNDPNSTTVAGSPCDDGDNTTINDILDANCNCVGTPTACTGIGDADNDGVCADIDCDDNDPGNTNFPGAACDDGNPNTYGETIQSDCSCGGGISSSEFTCVQVNTGSDDAEERSGRVDLGSSDLELVIDPNLGSQVIGLRFNGLNIPQGVTITNAYLQFTSDEDRNTNPCNLIISGQASDNPPTFDSANDTDVSNRPRTTASVNWLPPEWLAIGEATAAQRTPNLASVIQEIVSRNGYSSGSSIVLFLEGEGARTAESFEGDPFGAPQLCVAYSTVQYDCPSLQANIGGPCDDGDNTTINDTVDANCNCAGTPTACTGIGDADGDGVCANVDCDDNDASITSSTLNDADCDGSPAGVDCDDNDPAVSGQSTWYADVDGDGFGDPNNTTQACSQPAGFVADNTDCDDSEPNANPAAQEVCDGIDNDCDGLVDDEDPSIIGLIAWFADTDGDGFGDPNNANFACSQPAGFVADNTDCDDTNGNVHPAAQEICDGIDNDCDGLVDGDDPSVTGLSLWYADTDGDGFGDPNNSTLACNQPAGFVADNTDCNDSEPNANPAAQEVCDGIDNDCDGLVDGDDPSSAGQATWYADVDGDGFGDPNSTTQSCNQPANYVSNNTDCDDSNGNIHPAAQEICDGIDNDCDGLVDNDDPSVSGRATWYADADGDGFGDPNNTTLSCGQPAGFVADNTDCDDTNGNVHPAAQEICDGIDNDCDGLVDGDDPSAIGQATWYADADGDGFGNPNSTTQACSQPDGFVADNTDCDDTNGNIHPAAQEVCDGIDNDCDGLVDNDDPSVTGQATWYADTDGDGFGDPNNSTLACSQPDGFVADNTDCDDTSASFGSNANDMDCDGVPSGLDCDDSDPNVTSTNVGDADCDGVPTAVDCNDNDPTIGSNANDMDCDGVPSSIDCDDNDPSIISSNVGDADCDGVPATVDCDDNDPTVTHQPGDACDDGDPATFGETYQSDCSCAGGTSTPTTACATINASDDDVEEYPDGSMDRNSSDLELILEPRHGVQKVGLRFNGLNIPQGSQVVGAYIQFTVDETRDEDPCTLTIYGEASDNALTFSNTAFDVSNRPRTNASVSWSPQPWLAVGDAGPAQKTVDISSVIQEVVNRSGYSSSSSIALIIEGTGRRVAISFDGDALAAPQLCIDFFDTPPNYDCPSLSAFIGDPCNDGDNTTINDRVDGDCNCAGTPTACTGIGDADGDGICADVDCDDNDPNNTAQPGDACDDGDPATVNDVITANCGCAGTLNTCPNAGDNDGDGICADVDCDDNDPNITYQVGDACDDGNPNTHGETIQSDCSCGGGSVDPLVACSEVSLGSDDAEERLDIGRVDLNSSDLELCTDATTQVVGLRFQNLNIPQGANIVSAYIQFEADETRNDDPINLTIYGQAADNATTFTNADFDISSRPKTVNSVAWSPAQWLAVGDAGPAQQTPDLSAVIQEIVNRNGYTSASSIAIVIEGTGRRVAESFNGPAGGPALCIEYFATPPDYDCPNQLAFIGDPCDDGDNTTLNDMVDGDCDCVGTPTACTGIGDADGDGVCANVDCDDNNPNITTQPGDACDDGDPATVNDVITANCGCAGTLNTCPGVGDNDGDGICADVDCDDNDPNITYRPGDVCEDGDPNTFGETIQSDCTCDGGVSAPTQTCSMINADDDDAEEEIASGTIDRNSSDLELAVDPRFGNQAIGMRFNGLNIPQGAIIASAKVQFSVDEAVNDDPCNINIYGEASDNPGAFTAAPGNISGRPKTTATVSWAPPAWLAVGDAGPDQQTPDLSAIIQEIVNRGGYTASSSIVLIMDGTGRRTAESVNGSLNGAPELCVEYLYAPQANRPAYSPGPTSVESMELTNGAANSSITVAGGKLLNEGSITGPISIHPNPAKGRLTVTFLSTAEVQVQLIALDMNGKVVYSKPEKATPGENTSLLDVSSLPDGIYILHLLTDRAIHSEKFIIQK